MEHWQKEVEALEDKIAELQQKIDDMLDEQWGYGPHRVDGSMQELKELMKELADLIANKPK